MEKKNHFDPLAWAAASNDNAALINGQATLGQVNSYQCCAEGCQRSVVGDRADLMTVINEILTRGINITESYGDWIKVGFALAEELGAEGRETFHQLSAMSTKYNPTECERKWHSLLRSNSGRVTRSTIFWMAEQAGIDISAI